MSTAIVVLIIIAAIVVALVVLIRRETARTKRVIAVAQELGMRVTNDKNIFKEIGTELFSWGAERNASNALEATIDKRRALLFEYAASDGGNEPGKAVFLTVTAFASPEHNLPSFVLGKKGLLNFGAVDIEAGPEFAGRFVVSGKDKGAILSLFTPSLINFLISTELDKQWTLEGAGNWLVFHRGEKRLPTEQWRSFLEGTSQIAGQFYSVARSFDASHSGTQAATGS